MLEVNYEKHLIRKPVENAYDQVVGRQSPMTYMSHGLVPGCPIQVDLSWIYAIPEPNPYMVERKSDYDQIILNIGGDPYHPEVLGAEMEFYLGGKSFTLNVGSAIYIPKGVSYGPITWNSVNRPYLEMKIGLIGAKAEKQIIGLTHDEEDMSYDKYIIKEPIYREGVKTIQGPLGPVMLYMCNDLVPESDIYIDYLWMFGIPEPHIFEHSHDFDEVVLHISGDPYNQESLGAEIQFCVGGQPLLFNQTTAIYIPKGVKHGPLTWNKFDRPHIQMPIVLGAGTLDEAKPAGYDGDEPFFKNIA